MLRNEPFIPKFESATRVVLGQPIEDDPRLNRLVTSQLHPRHTFKVIRVTRWSDGAERFTVVPVGGSESVYGPASMFTFVD